MERYLLGLDVGGTKIECALIQIRDNKKIAKNSKDEFLVPATHNFKGGTAKIIAKERIPTDRQKGYEKVTKSIASLCKKICDKEKIKINDLFGIGIGLPGTVDPRTHKMLNGNTAIFIDKDLSTDLKKELGFDQKILCENDANCFALAEVLCGAGTKYTSETGIPFTEHVAIGVILGTGVGGGIIVHGNILQGKKGGGGEIGHSAFLTGGHPCYCGRNGCAEQYLSGPSIEALYATRLYAQIEKRPTAKEIFEMCKNQEPIAIAVVAEYRKNLAKFLANISNILDPHYFVLGGGVSTQDQIYLKVEENIAFELFLPHTLPRVYHHVLGDSAGVIGAAINLML